MGAGANVAVIFLLLLASGLIYLYSFDYSPFSSITTVSESSSTSNTSSPTGECPTLRTIPKAHILRVPVDYSTISAAIAASSPGDVVQVLSGNYSGFTIDRAVKLMACYPKVIIKGGVILNASGSGISGFEIYGSTQITSQLAGSNVGQHPPNGALILAHGSTNNAVSDNLLLNSKPNATFLYGVAIFSGKTNQISNNTEIGFSSGVVLDSNSLTDYSDNNTISWNTIFMPSFSYGNLSGIVDLAANSKILNNNIRTCFQGIILIGFNATVSGNTIKNCLTGVEAAQLSVGQSTHNRIFDNNFIENYVQATDNGLNNTWYSGHTGNYWSDWTTLNKPRPIDGSANTLDEYPLPSPYISKQRQTNSTSTATS